MKRLEFCASDALLCCHHVFFLRARKSGSASRLVRHTKNRAWTAGFHVTRKSYLHVEQENSSKTIVCVCKELLANQARPEPCRM